MEIQETATEHHRTRSLDLALSFLDEYHPVAEDRLALVHATRDRVRSRPTSQDILNLAAAVEGADFSLRRGTVKKLPGLVRRIRDAAQEPG